jgi:hypothetical protein
MLRHRERVGHVGLARRAELLGMLLAGEFERAP